MSGDGSWEVQSALFDRLVAAGVNGGAIFDDVAAEPAYPYVEIGESASEPQDADLHPGTSEVVTLYVYSRQAGWHEIKQIMSDIQAALHEQRLTVEGRDALCFWEGSLTRRDPDGVTRQGVIRIRVSSYE